MIQARGPVAGALVAGAIALLVGSGFAALFLVAGDRSDLASVGPYLARVLTFSLTQAAVSTMLSLVLGTAIALALARRRFPGRSLVVAALGAASVMPAIVVVFAVTTIYGRSGWLATGMAAIGLAPEFRIFGWPGILIAHVFLNAPFVARVYLGALGAVPAEHWRLAETLGFAPLQVFRHLDWPIVKSELGGIAGLVFLLCFTSFAIVLTLGGGGGRATLEVAIYQALNADLDFARAAWLGLVQVLICAGLAVLLYLTLSRPPVGRTVRLEVARPDAAIRSVKVLDGIVLAAGALLVAPLLASFVTSLRHLGGILEGDVARACAISLAIGLTSALASCLMALALATASRFERLARGRRRAILYDLVPAIVLAVPPFALTAGLFLIVRRWVDPALAGFLLLPLVNALGALPFAYRFVTPAVMAAGERYGRLADLLGLEGWARIRVVDWPLLRRPLAAAFAMAMALSFGDFGIVALFGGTELRTLPYLMYERLGAYRLDEASALALALVCVTFFLTYLSARLTDAAG